MSRKAYGVKSPWNRRMGLLHQLVGVTAAAFVLILALTGLLLNHTERLQLDSRFVRFDALLTWYGIDVPHPPISYRAGAHWISQIGEWVYFDEREAVQVSAKTIGAAAYSGGVAVAFPDRLLLFDEAGALIETLGEEHGLPPQIRAIAGGDELKLDTAHGTFSADPELTEWGRAAARDTAWARAASAPPALQAQWVEHYRGKGLSWERVLRDLHSGNVFGRWGFVVMDIAALALLILAGSGVWLWARGRTAKTRGGL